MGTKKEEEEEGRISIHADLVLEILSRFPVKTLSRLKCLSKEYAKIIQSPNFVDSCLSISSNRRLLIYFRYREPSYKFVFYSASHRSNSSIAPTRRDLTVHGGDKYNALNHPPVRGLILCSMGHAQHVICNPATGQKLSLPQNQILVGTKVPDTHELVLLGHDPILDQFKVLSLSLQRDASQCQCQCMVLTVGRDGNLWRKVQNIPNCFRPVCPEKFCGDGGICINGILYFKVNMPAPDYFIDEPTHLVSFDLNSEKFSFVEFNSHFGWLSKLVNFQGKLGFISRVKDCEIEFSILMENKKWSSRIFHLPWVLPGVKEYKSFLSYKSYCNLIPNCVVGVCDDEIVYVPPGRIFTDCTWRFHLEKRTVEKVKFEFPSDYSSDYSSVHYFANHFDTTISF